MTEPSWLDAFMPAHLEHVAGLINHAVNGLTPMQQAALGAALRDGSHSLFVLSVLDPPGVRVFTRDLDGNQRLIWTHDVPGGVAPQHDR